MEEEIKKQPQEKLTYEQLENVANQLSEQSKQLYQKLQEANIFNTFKRLDYLFKVIEFKSTFNPAFVATCLAEIEDIMTPEEDVEEPCTGQCKA